MKALTVDQLYETVLAIEEKMSREEVKQPLRLAHAKLKEGLEQREGGRRRKALRRKEQNNATTIP